MKYKNSKDNKSTKIQNKQNKQMTNYANDDTQIIDKDVICPMTIIII